MTMTTKEESSRILRDGALVVSADPALRDDIVSKAVELRMDAAAPGAATSERLLEGGYGVVIVDADELPGGAGYFILDVRRRHPDVVVLVVATDPSKEFLIELLGCEG